MSATMWDSKEQQRYHRPPPSPRIGNGHSYQQNGHGRALSSGGGNGGSSSSSSSLSNTNTSSTVAIPRRVSRLFWLLAVFTALVVLSPQFSTTSHRAVRKFRNTRVASTLRPYSRTQLSQYLSSYIPQPVWPRHMDGLPLHHHPILELIRDAQQTHSEKTARQSENVQEAEQEYRRRYEKAPPQDFDRWFTRAKEAGAAMKDNYDVLMRKLDFFAPLSPEEIQDRTWALQNLTSFSLLHIEKGVVSTSSSGIRSHPLQHPERRARGLAEVVKKFAALLPDMTLAINEEPDPRMLPSWELLQKGVHHKVDVYWPDPLFFENETFWEYYSKSCPPGSLARLDEQTLDRAKGRRASFLGDYKAVSHDTLCNGEEKTYPFHSQFFRDQRIINGTFPVFSVSTMEAFADIPFPSPWYYLEAEYRYGGEPVPFDKKTNKIFWRGAANPGQSHPPDHQPDYPRRRFAEMSSSAAGLEHEVEYTIMDDVNNTVRFGDFRSDQINDAIMDVALMNDWHCGTPRQCAGMKGGNYMLTAKHVQFNEVGKYKVLLDLDGSGYSGRFAGLLGSGGAVIKSTIYEEFFTDWIVPWYHFIPLSLTYDEFYDIWSYFLGLPRSTNTIDANNSPPFAAEHALYKPEKPKVSDAAKPEATQDKKDTATGKARAPLAPASNGPVVVLSNSGTQNASVVDSRSGNGKEARLAQLARIAENGQKLDKTFFSTNTMESYVYRMLLEWARLYRGPNWIAQSPDPYLKRRNR